MLPVEATTIFVPHDLDAVADVVLFRMRHLITLWLVGRLGVDTARSASTTAYCKASRSNESIHFLAARVRSDDKDTWDLSSCALWLGYELIQLLS